MDTSFDLVVVGGGPGGYVAAIRASQLGLKTACIESRVNKKNEPAYGGVCLNVGCIPTKSLLDSSYKYFDLTNGYKDHGITFNQAFLDVEKMVQAKDDVVDTITRSVSNLMASRGVTLITGWATVQSKDQVTVKHNDGTQSQLKCKNIILATGSAPREIPGFEVDNVDIFDSTGAIGWKEAPKKLCVIGSGAIGLEIGSIWGRLGAEVTVLEAQNEVLPQLDRDVVKELEMGLLQQNVKLIAGVKTSGVSRDDGKLNVKYRVNEVETTVTVDKIIVAAGRKPVTDQLVSNDVALDLDNNGFVIVDDYCQTSIEGIYAVGDMVRGPMLAHKASAEGVMVVERLAGQLSDVGYPLIPSIIYTRPEVAWVGLLPGQAKADGTPVKIGSYSFKAHGRAMASAENKGLIKIVSSADTGKVLGAVIIGPSAGELIHSVSVAMEFKASATELGSVVFAHPTFSEVVKEAALDCHGAAVHKFNARRRTEA